MDKNNTDFEFPFSGEKKARRIKKRPVLDVFCGAMELRMRTKDGENHLEGSGLEFDKYGCDSYLMSKRSKPELGHPIHIMAKLTLAIGQLSWAVINKEPVDIFKRAVDVANYAMMVCASAIKRIEDSLLASDS